MDFVAPLTPVGLALGRLGNFIGQELWGRPADVPWAMVFPNDPLGLARHPSQLYQFGLEGCLLFFILFSYSRKQLSRPGSIRRFLDQLRCAAIFQNFSGSPMRTSVLMLLGWMTRGQLLCLPMLVAGIGLLYWAYRPAKMRWYASVFKFVGRYQGLASIAMTERHWHTIRSVASCVSTCKTGSRF